MKATGISLYRVVAPILVLAAILAVALFSFDESYLPEANRQQEQLRAQIKGKPAQTFLNPDRKWISGHTDKAGDPERDLFYRYQAFDPDPDHYAFADLTVFEFDPQTFTLQRRIFAKSVRWDPPSTTGSSRTAGSAPSTANPSPPPDIMPSPSPPSPEIREQPGYFKKEYERLPGGCPTANSIFTSPISGPIRIRHRQACRVQLDNKLSCPSPSPWSWPSSLSPSAVSMGKRGGLIGIATAIGARHRLSRHRQPLQLLGRHQHLSHPSSPPGPLRPPFRHSRHLPPAPHPHLTATSCILYCRLPEGNRLLRSPLPLR